MLEKLTNLFYKKIFRDAFALYFGRGINLITGLASTLIYGIIFQKEQIAIISLFEMILNLFVSFGFTWSTTGIVRFGREQFLKNRFINEASNARLLIVGLILGLSVLSIFIFQDSLLEFIGTKDSNLVIFILINLIAIVIHEHITSLFNTAEKHVANAIFHISESIAKMCILLLFFFHILNLSPELYIKINVIVLTFIILTRIPFLEKNFIFPIKSVPKQFVYKYFRFVAPQIYGFAGMYLINWMDLYFIRKYASLSDLGAYQFLYSIFTKITSFAFLVNVLFFPKIISWKEENNKALLGYINKGPWIVFHIVFAACTIFFLVYQPLFSLFFKDKYAIAYPAFNLLIFTIPFFFVSFLYIPVLNSFDKVNQIQFVNIISASGNLLIDLFLIKYFGIIAAAFGTFIAYFVQFLFLGFYVKQLFNLKVTFLLVIGIPLTIFTCGYFLLNII